MRLRSLLASLTLSSTILTTALCSAPAPLIDPSAHVESSGLDDEARALVERLFTDAANGVVHECSDGCTEYACSEDCPARTSPTALLVKILVSDPRGAETLEPIAVESVLKKKTTRAQYEALIACLLAAPVPSTNAIAESMYEAAPKRFDSEVLLSFCERGSEALIEPLAALVKKGKASVFAAAYLAHGGDAAGKSLLRKTLRAKSADPSNALELLVAAGALERLGSDGALQRARLLVHDATIAALDARHLDDARALAVTALIAHSAAQRLKVDYSLLTQRRDRTLLDVRTVDELKGADAIFQLIEGLTPLG